MTIQELINQLQFAVDKIGYEPDTHLVIETNENIESEQTYSGIYLDTDSMCDPDKKNWKISINVLNDEDISND
jgi:hypothetical protein